MAGYVRVFDKTAGDRIDAEDFNDEYVSLAEAFDNTNGHSHDGTAGSGGLVPRISGPNGYTSVIANSTNKEIEFAVENVGVKEVQMYLRNGILVPALPSDVSLGDATNKFNELHVAEVNANRLNLTVGPEITGILDEDDMLSDSASALATQQSIKAYVDSSIATSAGIFMQSKIVRRFTDQALTGAMADYLMTTIDLEAGSYVVLFANVTAMQNGNAGSVFARIYQGTTAVGYEDVYVTSSNISGIDVYGSTTIVERAGPFTAGTYTFAVKMRQQSATGTALNANLLILEEKP